MNPFHTLPLYNKLPTINQLAWLLASVTMPPNIHQKDDTPLYRREHTRLWNIEIHRRATRIRETTNDQVKH